VQDNLAAAGELLREALGSKKLKELRRQRHRLAEHGAQLMAARIDLVNELAPEVEKAYQLLAPGSRAAARRGRTRSASR